MPVAGSFIRVTGKESADFAAASVFFFITEDSHMTWNPTENNVFPIFLLRQCSPSETFEQDQSQD